MATLCQVLVATQTYRKPLAQAISPAVPAEFAAAGTVGEAMRRFPVEITGTVKAAETFVSSNRFARVVVPGVTVSNPKPVPLAVEVNASVAYA